MLNQEGVLKQLNKSGFPFQIKIEQEIRATCSKHGWSVESREHPWTNPETGSTGFIDLILKYKRQSAVRLVIECKRMKTDDSRQLQWLFLTPDQQNELTNVASCLEVKGIARPKTWEEKRIWDDVSVTPMSYQSEFCILLSDESRRQPILESLAAGVLESSEGLAEEEVKIRQSQNRHS